MVRQEHVRPEIQEMLDSQHWDTTGARKCIDAGEHQASERHSRVECPTREVEGTTDELPHLQPHDWRPGTETHPMHTDPMCIDCGLPKKAPVHR